MDAADQLRSFMVRKKITQDDFPRVHGISQAAVSAWVMRRKRPSLKNALRLERIARIKVSSWADVKLEPLPRSKERAA